jgi:pyridoxine kinase
MGSASQIDLLINKIEHYNNGCLYICDPVMADNGKLYSAFDMAFVEEMKKLVKKADVVIPNLTEASFILNRQYKESYTKEEIKTLLKELTELGPKTSILTGISFEENKLGAMAYDSINKQFYEFFTDRIHGYYHGTGDLFSSAVVGCLLNGLDLQKTLQISTIFTYQSIEQTYKDKLDIKYGVEFELFLEEYSKNIRNSL